MDVSSGRVSVRVCQRCGKEYQAGGYKFCSRECMLGTGTCKKCGKAFQREAVGQKKCRACQGHAQERACPVCGKVVSLQAHRTYCSKACYEQARARVPDHCPVCGVDVPKGRLYCTDACRDRAHGMVRVCQQCGRVFKRGKPDQLYCSQECAWQAQKRVRKAVCQQCGKEFVVGRACKGMFCSKMCEWASMRKDRGLARCEACGREFTPRNGSQRFCSPQCAVDLVRSEALGFEAQYVRALRWMARLSCIMGSADDLRRECVVCGKTFVPRDARGRTCSEECARRYRNSMHDRRIYRNGTPDLTITLPALFRRDGGRCARCGLPMTFDCDPNSDDYPSIDHIIPLAKGGLHRWFNVQLMCRGCNSDKRDEMPAGFVPVQTSLDAFAN